MLHQCWQIALLLGLTHVAWADDARVRAPITGAERQALAERLAPQVVQVRRITPPPRNITIPGHGPLDGYGWWAAPGRVLTASVMVQDWPRSEKDQVLVRSGTGEWRPATVGLMDIQLGVAILDVEGQPGDPPAPPVAPPSTGAIFSGRQVYAAMQAQKKDAPKRADGGLVNVLIARPAGGHLAYYWLLGGPVAIGMPLFDAHGRLVTLVGLKQPTGSTFALPVKALAALYERASDWVP
jgi:hypothetical protein